MSAISCSSFARSCRFFKLCHDDSDGAYGFRGFSGEKGGFL